MGDFLGTGGASPVRVPYRPGNGFFNSLLVSVDVVHTILAGLARDWRRETGLSVAHILPCRASDETKGAVSCPSILIALVCAFIPVPSAPI